jgi:Dyp-type peroxidase family
MSKTKKPVKPVLPFDPLNNSKPLPDKSLDAPGNRVYKEMLDRLQGNILKGHGRDFSANIFVEFTCSNERIAEWLKNESKIITTTAIQFKETQQFKQFGIPGDLFRNIYLTAALYRKLGIKSIESAFKDDPEADIPVLPQKANFLGGMKKASDDLFDNVKEMQERRAKGKTESLENAYLSESIHAMILLADDSESYLHRVTRDFITMFEDNDGSGTPLGRVLAIELGIALRNQEGEGIEHFGYIDGRSQPLYLASDFKNLTASGEIDLIQTKEKVNENATKKETGDIDIWNPFASLNQVLIKDKLAGDEYAYGSYFVFRKLEQDVMRFSIEEQLLADKLQLFGKDRERAGAMAVGRFRDGTPLTLSETDNFIPAKSNNFRYDGLDSALNDLGHGDDKKGLQCPFHAHIRKTNPRQSTQPFTGASTTIKQQEEGDLSRRITRRGIPFGTRVRAPNAFQALDDLPTGGVGLLFGCFQSSIVKQFAFMQKTWVNNVDFKVATTGVDPLIGQRKDPSLNPPLAQHWRKTYGEDNTGQEPNEPFPESHPVSSAFSDFIQFKGGEFFFAPSLTFFQKLPKLISKTK